MRNTNWFIRFAFATVCIGLSVAWAAAGQAAAQARDTAVKSDSRVAQVEGQVVDGVTGNAVTRAKVRLAGGQQFPPPLVLTDAEGKFAFQWRLPQVTTQSLSKSLAI